MAPQNLLEKASISGPVAFGVCKGGENDDTRVLSQKLLKHRRF